MFSLCVCVFLFFCVCVCVSMSVCCVWVAIVESFVVSCVLDCFRGCAPGSQFQKHAMTSSSYATYATMKFENMITKDSNRFSRLE